ncbi:hypothetical protein AAY473_006379 [Plecturocebus cupreus]
MNHRARPVFIFIYAKKHQRRRESHGQQVLKLVILSGPYIRLGSPMNPCWVLTRQKLSPTDNPTPATTAAREMRMIAQGCKYPLGLITFVGVWLMLTVFVTVNTSPVSWEVVLVGSRVDPGVVLMPGAEVVDDAPIVGVPRPEVFGTIPGTAWLVAEAVDSIPGAMVTELEAVGLVPVVLVPIKQVTQDDAFVAEMMKGEWECLEQRGMNLTNLWWRWLRRAVVGEKKW